MSEKDLRPDLYQYMLEFSLEGGRLPQNLIRGLQQRIQRYTMSDSELMCFNGDEWRKFYFEKNVISDLSSSDKTFDKNAHHYCI